MIGAKHCRGGLTAVPAMEPLDRRRGDVRACSRLRAAVSNGLVEHTDLALGSVVEAAECGRCGPGSEFGDALATVGPVLDTGCPGGHQVLQLLEVMFQGKSPAPIRQASEEGQHGGIDAIGLG